MRRCVVAGGHTAYSCVWLLFAKNMQDEIEDEESCTILILGKQSEGE